VTTDLVVLAGMLAILFPLGWWLFPLGIEKARRNGSGRCSAANIAACWNERSAANASWKLSGLT
jgi:hypothetical protein